MRSIWISLSNSSFRDRNGKRDLVTSAIQLSYNVTPVKMSTEFHQMISFNDPLVKFYTIVLLPWFTRFRTIRKSYLSSHQIYTIVPTNRIPDNYLSRGVTWSFTWLVNSKEMNIYSQGAGNLFTVILSDILICISYHFMKFIRFHCIIQVYAFYRYNVTYLLNKLIVRKQA